MDTPLDIRLARSDDLTELLRLYTHLHPDDPPCPPDAAQTAFEQLIGNPGSAIFLGFIEGTLTTSCTLVVISNLTRGGAPYGLIENVVTHSQHRGHGYGTEILQAAVQHAFDHHCYKVMLMTGSQDPQTLGFYARAGFEQSKAGFQQRR